MASPPTSEAAPEAAAEEALRFLDAQGQPTEAPAEWERAWLELAVPLEPWAAPHVTVNGRPLAVLRRELAGRERVLVEWERAGAGYYRLALHHPQVRARRLVRIHPWKLSPEAFEAMLDDLEQGLPVAIALALQRGGALADVDPRALRPPTLAEELERLRSAVEGRPGRPGLLELLPALARRPHRVLRETALWVRRERVRRIGHAGLRQAILRPANLEEVEGAPKPRRAPDRRVEPHLDVYENRIVRAFADEVDARVRRLAAALAERSSPASLAEEAGQLRDRLRRARRAAPFLDEVSPLAHAPRQLTMVLLRRPEYRAVLEGWLALRRSMALRLREPALDAPLQNTPFLYELWATLLVVRALLEAGTAAGFRVVRQELVRRRGGGLWVEALPAGRPALVLTRSDGTRITLTAQQSYGRTGELRSVSFTQRPDISIRIDRPGAPPELLLFDPKYKLDSEARVAEEEDEGEPAPRGQPRKVDIDKMHAYRDAVRTSSGARIVHHASILFPGDSVVYDEGVGAVGALPGRSAEATFEIARTLSAMSENFSSRASAAREPDESVLAAHPR